MDAEDLLAQQLTRTLHRHAEAPGPLDLPPSAVRSRAHRIRRARRTGVALAACAVVAAVVVPTTVTMQSGQAGQHLQPVHSGPPSPAPTSPASPSRSASPGRHVPTLASIPRGADAHVTYVDADGVVHSTGGTSKLPSAVTPDLLFTAYHGGWLVAGGADDTLRQYLGGGELVASGRSGGIAVSGDRMRTAFGIDGEVHEGLASGMSDGEQHWKVPAGDYLLGFLPHGPVVGQGDGSIRILETSGVARTVRLGMEPTSTSESADLVGGITGSVAKGDLQGAVVDMRTRKTLWHGDWRPLRFSEDGTLLAAVPVYDNGDPSRIAILDARTGAVVAQTPKLDGNEMSLGGRVAWQGHRLVLTAVGGHGRKHALLTLSTNGTLTRSSDIVRTARPGRPAFVFAVQP